MKESLRSEIVRVCNEITGWCTPEKAVRLCELIEETKAGVVVEIGVWAGRSAVPMAMMLRAMSAGGTILCIDPWNAHVSTEGYDQENAHWWGSQDHEMIFRLFTEKVAREGLCDHVIVCRDRSDVALVPDAIDILHIDGQHTEQAIRDVQRYASKVPVGGYVVMDDTGWTNNGIGHVSMAVHLLLEMGFGDGEPLEAGAVFRRLSCAPDASKVLATASAGL
jgi:hypothetical protein